MTVIIVQAEQTAVVVGKNYLQIYQVVDLKVVVVRVETWLQLSKHFQ
jgi:hypothetical protein